MLQILIMNWKRVMCPISIHLVFASGQFTFFMEYTLCLIKILPE